MNNMVVGTIFSSLLSSMLSSGPSNNQAELEAQRAKEQAEKEAAEKAAEERRIAELKAQEEYAKMMQTYKPLEGSGNLGFKSLDGEAEPPKTAPVLDYIGAGAEKPTAFFGDVMPEADLQTLVEPESNPSIVDLRETKKYLDEKVENQSPEMVNLLRQYEPDANGQPIIPKPDCINLSRKLKGFTEQRLKFQKTVSLAHSELEIWETANRNALFNAAKDGIEYFTGQLLEGLNKRGAAAEKLQSILDKNKAQMVKDGLNIADIQAKIDRCRQLSSAGKMAEVLNNVNDWQSFIKDGVSSILNQLTSSNDELKDIFENPATSKYFQTEAPELNTLLDLSKIAAANQVFGKWVAKKIPMIALVEISIKQAYNGLDYFLSLKRIMEGQKINSGVMETAKYIQKNIDDTYLALKDCPK
jgi:hypothetical protein